MTSTKMICGLLAGFFLLGSVHGIDNTDKGGKLSVIADPVEVVLTNGEKVTAIKVTDVYMTSPIQSIKSGDIIFSIDKQVFKSAADMAKYIKSIGPGIRFEVVAKRGDSTVTITSEMEEPKVLEARREKTMNLIRESHKIDVVEDARKLYLCGHISSAEWEAVLKKKEMLIDDKSVDATVNGLLNEKDFNKYMKTIADNGGRHAAENKCISRK